MTPNEYQQLALRTESVPAILQTGRPQHDAKMTRLLHAAMGICTEVGELAQAVTSVGYQRPLNKVNAMEELGDVLWYVAVGFDALGLPMPARPEDPGEQIGTLTLELSAAAGALLDLLKKHLFYGKPFDPRAADAALAEVYRFTVAAVYELDYTLEHAMERNIAKLEKRYPQKFTAEAALTRDLEAERKALEGGS